jgi:hypothetical protein
VSHSPDTISVRSDDMHGEKILSQQPSQVELPYLVG